MSRDGRMSRVWAPSTLTSYAMVAGSAIEVDLLTALDLTMDRTVRDWTVTRLIGRLQIRAAGQNEFYYGIRVANDNVTPGMISPEFQQTADWLLWGGGTTSSAIYELRDAINIDNRSQRKSMGAESRLVLYVTNAGFFTQYVTWKGRSLMLLP